MLVLNADADQLDQDKYRGVGETFEESRERVAHAISDGEDHYRILREIFLDGRFLPGGRIMAGMGSIKSVTPYNCYVSGTIYDNFVDKGGIMDRATEAVQTMRMGGGIGYDFSPLRPRGNLIKSLQSRASGPVSFMGIYDAACHSIQSAGHRRGAQMGVLRIDHPDILEFVHAKGESGKLTTFNISVAITDEFMDAVINKRDFKLRFGGKVYSKVDARKLWDMIMRVNYDWSEPGVIFIDRVNEYNNLYYCEKITATNPCGEQPLPPYGACLLGSFNLTRYVKAGEDNKFHFDYETFTKDIPPVIRGMDNIVDRASYPLPAQEEEAKSKRRMGIGVTGLANTLEALGAPYGSQEFIQLEETILALLGFMAYTTSIQLAKEKGAFPLFDKEKYVQSKFISERYPVLQDQIYNNGIRNSHLLSIAPTGTISLVANNVSSGIEPTVSHSYNRTIQKFDGPVTVNIYDYGFKYFNVKGKTIKDVSAKEHIDVLCAAQKHVDSAVSKTCNVPQNIKWDEFEQVYLDAYNGGAKGCTTAREGNKRCGIFQTDDAQCYVDPLTGRKECV